MLQSLSLSKPQLSIIRTKPTYKTANQAVTEGPVQFLRSLFPKDDERYVSQPSTVDPDDMNAYDMESVQAIRANNVKKLRELLDNRKSFDACNRNGETLLHLACRRGNLSTVKFLIEEAQVRTDVCDDMGRTVLHDVCWRPTPDLDLMDYLIRVLSPDVLLAADRRGHTPFDYARREHWSEWMKFLQDRQDLIERRVMIVDTFLSASQEEKYTSLHSQS
jgi:ankyrin repeat protein